MKPFPDFNTPQGIRAVADYLEEQAELPHPDGASIRVGHLKIHATLRSLLAAADTLRQKAPAASKPNAGVWGTPSPPKDYGKRCDAGRHCGTPEAALETIERQLAAQGAYMEAADVARCQMAAGSIRRRLLRAEKKEEERARAKSPGLAEAVSNHKLKNLP